MKTTSLKAAIARSRSHNESVTVEVGPTKIADVMTELDSIYEGDTDYARENDGSYDVWGWTDETAEGEMDWRLNVAVETTVASHQIQHDNSGGRGVARDYLGESSMSLPK